MLLGSTALDVAIGLVFVFLVVSLVCSAFSEGVESIFKNRAKDLERGIRELLTDTAPLAKSSTDYVALFYDHPLISSLFKSDYATAKKKWQLPSYIPAPSFALAVIDIIGASQMPLRTAAVDFAPKNPKLSKALVALIDAAGTDADRARLNIETWFNSSMDRVSGWYKHRAQIIIALSGLTLSAAANVDSIAIVRMLSTDSGVREALVAQAKNPPSATAPDPAKEPVARLRELGIPIGWHEPIPVPGDYYAWAMKIIGIILTALAVSLGAPFWFDLLNTFIVVRSTVKPSEKSTPERSKD